MSRTGLFLDPDAKRALIRKAEAERTEMMVLLLRDVLSRMQRRFAPRRAAPPQEPSRTTLTVMQCQHLYPLPHARRQSSRS